jgi:hypothetical protein
VGKLLLQKWKLPPALADAVETHHGAPSDREADAPRVGVSLIITVADTLTKIAGIGFGGDGYVHASNAALWGSMPLQEQDYVTLISSLSKNVEEIKGFFGIGQNAQPSSPPVSDADTGERLRVAFYSSDIEQPFIPARIMLQQFFQVECFPPHGDIQGGIERTKPHMVFVDLSSEHRTEKISEILKAYRGATGSPLVFLLPRKVSKETEEKSAKVGIFFLCTPFCPQEMIDRLGQMNLR